MYKKQLYFKGIEKATMWNDEQKSHVPNIFHWINHYLKKSISIEGNVL